MPKPPAHVQLSSGEVRCSECEFTAVAAAGKSAGSMVTRHYFVRHGVACEYCGRKFKRKVLLADHYSFEVPNCSKSLPVSRVRMHTNLNEKAITLSLRNYAKRRYKKKKKKKPSQIVDPFACKKCEVEVMTKPLLNEHILRVHGVNCRLCGGRFKSRYLLFKHESIEHAAALSIPPGTEETREEDPYYPSTVTEVKLEPQPDYSTPGTQEQSMMNMESMEQAVVYTKAEPLPYDDGYGHEEEEDGLTEDPFAGIGEDPLAWAVDDVKQEPMDIQIGDVSSVEGSFDFHEAPSTLQIAGDSAPCDQSEDVTARSKQLQTQKRSQSDSSKRTKKGAVFSCFRCNYRSCAKNRLRDHVRTQHTGDQCDICDFVPLTLHELKQHRKTEHDVKCKRCSYRTVAEKYLRRHYDANVCGYPCGLCTFTAPKLRLLKDHERELNHQAEGRYACDQCAYVTTQPRNLKLHKEAACSSC